MVARTLGGLIVVLVNLRQISMLLLTKLVGCKRRLGSLDRANPTIEGQRVELRLTPNPTELSQIIGE
jgi:hypothetical protein